MTDEQFKLLLKFLNGFENHLQVIEDILNQMREKLP